MKRLFLLLILMISCIVTNAQQNSLNPVYEAYKKTRSSNDNTAKSGFSLLKTYANNGNESAQQLLAICYEEGYGVNKDYDMALSWFRILADKGNNAAIYNMANMLYSSMGRFRDAEQWLIKLYNKSNGPKEKQVKSWAAHDLAELYSGKFYLNLANEYGFSNGKTVDFQGNEISRSQYVPEDYSKAIQFYEAELRIGQIKSSEIEKVKKSIEYCRKRLNNSAQLDFEESKDNILVFMSNRDEKAARAAFDELQKFAVKDVPEAHGLLGHFYLKGIGTSPSIKDAVYWTKRGAEGNDLFSISELGLYYIEGLGVEKNVQEGIRLETIAASRDYPHAAYTLGTLYSYHDDFIQMEKWYKKACDLKHGWAFHNLASYYHENQQEAKAVNLLLEAVQLDNRNELIPSNKPGAFENLLGLIYDYGGNGVTKNLYLAKQWYEKAVAKGNTKAAMNLEDLKNRM